ncbi:SMC family ATPase [Microbacteriaceae bacterium VKM Ac-2855]|nr:SMC family ATPase [Microbacteriaceae bacterium VKM Ac-2855]
MRILRVRFAGIGPYRDEQSIDFEGLEDDGIYLIAGRTGAGKSTILDAICFALYGSVPRFDGGPSNLRSDHSGPEDPSFAELEFEAGGGRYLLFRSPEYQRPAKRGGGLTKNAAKAQLAVWRGDAWEGVSTHAREIGDEVLALVGLTKDQFLQVMLLAQNRFHEFLLAKNDDRQRLLRSLFATERFDVLRKRLIEKRQTSALALDAERTIIAQLAKEAADLAGVDESTSPDEEWFAALAPALAPRVAVAAEAAARADERLAMAVSRRDEVVRLQALQRRRAAAVHERDRLAESDAEVAELRVLVERARRADAVWPLLAVEKRAEAAAADAAAAAARATRAFEAVCGEGADAEAIGETATAQLGAIEAAVAEEERLPATERSAAAAAVALERADATRVQQERALAEIPPRLDEIETALRAARSTADQLDSRAATVTASLARAEAAVAAEQAARRHSRSVRAHLALVDEHSAATRRHAGLVAERFSGFAAELAARLRDGEPCAVCGALEHPAPAVHIDTRSVSPEEVDEAWAEVARLARATGIAAADAAADGEELAALTARAGDSSVERSAATLRSDRAALAEAEKAIQTTNRLERDRRALLTERDSLATELATARARRDELVSAATAAATEAAALRSRVQSHRDGFATVAERAADLQRRRDLATAARTATASAASRAEAASAAGEAVVTELEACGFADRADVVASHRTAADVERLTKRMEEHAERRAAVAAILAEPELADLRTEPVEPAEWITAVEITRTERDEALARHATLVGDAGRLAGRVATAIERVRRSARELRGFDELRALSEAVDGKGQNNRRMDLEAFALAGRLEEIVDAANSRLATMTTGRYSLAHDDSLAYRGAASGLGLVVADAYTGARRQPSSLSGGETFLASLALALGLADVVTAQAGGITLDTMFIDEGFGSLDPETLEIAMSTLDGLRAGGRTVGLISHVEVMKERIPVGLHVEITDRGDSRIRVA